LFVFGQQGGQNLLYQYKEAVKDCFNQLAFLDALLFEGGDKLGKGRV
jgi:hypothetical protein